MVGLVESPLEVPARRLFMSASDRNVATPPPAALQPVVEVRHINKRFGVVQALEDVSLALLPGEVHGLVGENGAGKSTLTKIIGGVQRPDSGTLLIDGLEVSLSSPAHALRLGIVVIYQELSMVPELSVAANMFLGHEPRSFGMLDRKRMRRRTAELLERVGARFSPNRLAGELSVADQQLAEIARALNRESRLIIMDEPTAALPAEAHQHLFKVIRDLAAAGTTILYISHELDDVDDQCDRITIMKDGRWVSTTPRLELTRQEVIRRMVGRELGEMFPPRRSLAAMHSAPPALEVENLSLAGHFHDVSFDVRSGEIVGLAGLVGSGRSSLARAIFGSPPGYGGPASVHGTIRLKGRDVRIKGVRHAIRSGIAYIPEERKTDGIVLDLSIEQNIALPQLSELSRWGLLGSHYGAGKSQAQFASLAIRAPSLTTEAGKLSGGNQQKVVLAKWLSRGCEVLLLDEPTRGIDVGAKVEIYRLLRELTAQGLGILLISSDMPEVLGLSDRILVMRRGRIVGSFEGSDVSEEDVIRLALGAEEVSHVGVD